MWYPPETWSLSIPVPDRLVQDTYSRYGVFNVETLGFGTIGARPGPLGALVTPNSDNRSS